MQFGLTLGARPSDITNKLLFCYRRYCTIIIFYRRVLTTIHGGGGGGSISSAGGRRSRTFPSRFVTPAAEFGTRTTRCAQHYARVPTDIRVRASVIVVGPPSSLFFTRAHALLSSIWRRRCLVKTSIFSDSRARLIIEFNGRCQNEKDFETRRAREHDARILSLSLLLLLLLLFAVKSY